MLGGETKEGEERERRRKKKKGRKGIHGRERGKKERDCKVRGE